MEENSSFIIVYMEEKYTTNKQKNQKTGPDRPGY